MRKSYPSLLAITLISGCVLGPDFHRKPAPPVTHYTQEALPSKTVSARTVAGKSQFFVHGQDISAEWWKVFHSEPLNQLIQLALRANPDIQAANAGLRIAQETALAQRAFYYPKADLNFNSMREGTAHTLTPIAAPNLFFFNLITPQLTISYVPDVFGANRRQIESLEAQVAAEVFRREALILTISSNVAMAAIQEASLRAQVKAIKNIVRLAKNQLKMLNELFEAGQIGIDGVSAQKALLAQMEALLPPLELLRNQQEHLIAVLCGQFPSDRLFNQFELSSLSLPKNLPVSLPSALVQQRPDIRAAEAEAKAASALIGVAIAQRFPNILITAFGGANAFNIYTLFNSTTNFWQLSANLVQPVFNAGLLKHRQRAAVAAYKQADAQYRSVVLTAFQEVADTLKAIQYDAITLKANQDFYKAAKQSLSIANQQWQAGSIDHLAVLAAEQAYHQAAIKLVQSEAARFTDSIALFQALGGGWWNRGLVKDC